MYEVPVWIVTICCVVWTLSAIITQHYEREWYINDVEGLDYDD